PVDPNDPLYPCSVLPERYQTACYQMQTSVMLFNSKGDIAAAARACDGAPTAMRLICYTSLGRDISSYSLQNHGKAIAMCSLGTPRYQPWCYLGLVKNVVDINARAEEGISLCRDVPMPAGKLICYVAVGEQIVLLAQDDAGRRALCSSAEPAYVEACVYGARVTAAPPPGLANLWKAAQQ
ncbi:MAG TPA: hypothetical protein VHM24_01725, partial [Gemmatimonadaceae bacterium]|nr:hypothetical protein [Gemmatimonadaceae bacterium]